MQSIRLPWQSFSLQRWSMKVLSQNQCKLLHFESRFCHFLHVRKIWSFLVLLLPFSQPINAGTHNYKEMKACICRKIAKSPMFLYFHKHNSLPLAQIQAFISRQLSCSLTNLCLSIPVRIDHVTETLSWRSCNTTYFNLLNQSFHWSNPIELWGQYKVSVQGKCFIHQCSYHLCYPRLKTQYFHSKTAQNLVMSSTMLYKPSSCHSLFSSLPTTLLSRLNVLFCFALPLSRKYFRRHTTRQNNLHRRQQSC